MISAAQEIRRDELLALNSVARPGPGHVQHAGPVLVTKAAAELRLFTLHQPAVLPVRLVEAAEAAKDISPEGYVAALSAAQHLG